MRAVERIDPLSLYGKPWCRLEYVEQLELIGYATLREAEDAQEKNAEIQALQQVAGGRRGWRGRSRKA